MGGPGRLFRLMTPAQKQALFDNTARSIASASLETKRRHIENCTKADPAYGAGVARAMGLATDPQQIAPNACRIGTGAAGDR